MRILVSNDDGIYSPGIAALARAAIAFGDVRIFAPDVERSSAGHAITSSLPLSYRATPLPDSLDAYRVNGTPADCVALGIHQWGGVDVVLSGINIGSNLGNAIWHSGTLAAAKQALLLGIPGIALSTPSEPEGPDFDVLAPHVEEVLQLLLSQHRLPLVNVNLPPRPKGIRWTRQAVERYHGEVVPGTDPQGRQHFWFTVRPLEASIEGTDRWAVEHGLIALTPLRLDLTDHAALAKLREARELPRHEAATEPPQADAPPRSSEDRDAQAPRVVASAHRPGHPRHPSRLQETLAVGGSVTRPWRAASKWPSRGPRCAPWRCLRWRRRPSRWPA
jgi:5'-nucleotidase